MNSDLAGYPSQAALASFQSKKSKQSPRQL